MVKQPRRVRIRGRRQLTSPSTGVFISPSHANTFTWDLSTQIPQRSHADSPFPSLRAPSLTRPQRFVRSRDRGRKPVLASITAVNGPSAWTKTSLEEPDWLLSTSKECVEQLEVIRLQTREIQVPLADTDFGAFRRPALMSLAKRAQYALDHGPGFLVLRGWPVARWGNEVARFLYCGFGSLLGRPLPHNPQGHLARSIHNADLAPETSAKWGSSKSSSMVFHTDTAPPPTRFPRVLGLLCLRRAQDGGDSLLASGHSIHNRLLERYPALLEHLYKDFHFGRRSDSSSSQLLTDIAPVFSWAGSQLQVRYHPKWLKFGQEVVRESISSAGEAALNAFEEALAEEKMSIRFPLMSGDLLLTNNRVILHGRTAFEDGEDLASRRCLLRLWLA
jgi:alpha-ketoglutarate-dependent taurine dioxygenase